MKIKEILVINDMKKSKLRKAVIVLSCILGVVLLFYMVLVVLNQISYHELLVFVRDSDKRPLATADVYYNEEYGAYTFRTDRTLRILQLSDIHLGAGFLSEESDRTAIEAVRRMVEITSPDLIIVTGDIACSPFTPTGWWDNKATMTVFAELMESFGVYWTVTMGNHESESTADLSRGEVVEFLAKYQNSLVEETYDIHGDGYNQLIVLENAGEPFGALFMMDTHNLKGDGSEFLGEIFDKYNYDGVHANQVEWYAAKSAQLGVNSLVFIHIPLSEMAEAADIYSPGDENWIYGSLDEDVYSGTGGDELFETALRLGYTKGIFFGHDHINNASLLYKGIRLTYGGSIDALAYEELREDDSYRGGTIIEIDLDGNFDCRFVSVNEGAE